MKSFLLSIIQSKQKDPKTVVLQGVLFLLSLLFGFLTALRNAAYQIGLLGQNRLPKPVVSIGNITVGGSGKTPLVAWLARVLKDKGYQPAVLLRGYMDQDGSAKDALSDEAVMLKECLTDIPVLTGRNRFSTAVDFLQTREADVFIMDDGFQHRALHRDCDVVVVDASNPWGNGHLLPRGLLREPLSALNRADVVILTKTDRDPQQTQNVKQRIKQLAPDVPVCETEHRPEALVNMETGKVYDVQHIRGKKVGIVCGIGDPEAFRTSVRALGGHIERESIFMDHYSFERKDAQSITEGCANAGIKTVITTDKDAVKLRAFADVFKGTCDCLVLTISIVFKQGEELFLERVTRLL